MALKTVTIAGALAFLAGAAAFTAFPSGSPQAQNANDRYLVTQIEGGIMRVDRQTGEVSVCRGEAKNWRCELVPDDRVAYQREMDKLDAENRRLRRSESRPAWREGRRYDDYRRREPKNDFDNMDQGLMSPEEVDKAMDSVDRMMRRIIDTARRLQKDYGNDPLN